MVRRYARRLRRRLAELSPQKQATFLSTKEAFIKAPTSRHTGGWLERDAQELTEPQRAFVERLKELCPAASEAGKLTRWFRKLVKERRPTQLDEWLNAAQQSTVAELIKEFRSFAQESVRGG